MYVVCKDFSIYYNLRQGEDEDVRAGNLPANCSLIRLPVHSRSDDGGLFNFLLATFAVEWKLSEDCNQCHYGRGQCQTDITNKFHCTYPNNPQAQSHQENNPQAQSHQENNPHAQDTKTTRSKWGLALGAGAVLFTVGLLVLLFCFREKILWYKYIRFWESNAEDHQNIEAFLKNYGSCAPKRCNYLEVKRITSGFKNKLGQGGYGSLYKGCLHNGSHVAVKVLKKLKGSGEKFINEPHNILLDEDFCPKISDFGLAKLCMKKESIESMFSARGTIGYIAPEIVCRNLGGVSHKSDVYSYGMMVLEMVGGRKNVDVEVDRTSEIYFPH
ncbi:hypothetical protein KY284_022939 [Solanum tuberosum]|nr:hypothetical protein KY284_022939 [Solanum tuberosum]